jgi:hypothetical protein
MTTSGIDIGFKRLDNSIFIIMDAEGFRGSEVESNLYNDLPIVDLNER